MRKINNQQKISPYIFISPFYIVFAIFFLFPSVIGLILGFFRWNGISEIKFIGLANYSYILSDKVFWQSMLNTSVYAFIGLFIMVPISIILAVLLNAERLKYKHLWRAMYFIPSVLTLVAVAVAFQLLFNKDYGLINSLLSFIGVSPIPWLRDRIWVKAAVGILLIWRSLGLYSMYFLAGLQGIDKSLYESASIDGATSLHKFFYITIPMLKPITLFVSILVLLQSIQIFDELIALTGDNPIGAPANGSLSIVQYLYSRGFSEFRLGLASAVGTVIFLIVFLISMLQIKRYGMFKET